MARARLQRCPPCQSILLAADAMSVLYAAQTIVMNDPEILVRMTPAVKLLLLVSGTLLSLVCYYIMQIWEGLQKLNENFTKCFELFAPRVETNNRLDDLEETVGDHATDICVLKDWRNGVDFQLSGIDRRKSDKQEAGNGI